MRRSLAISRSIASAEYRCPCGSRAFARAPVRGGRGTSVFEVMGASAQNGQLSGSRNCGCAANQALSDGAALIERAFADCDDLKASVTAVVVILVGEASGLLPRKGLGFIETRLKVGADGRI